MKILETILRSLSDGVLRDIVELFAVVLFLAVTCFYAALIASI